jgi:hypothetical protein
MKNIHTFEEFLNEQEEILNEDSSLALMIILQAAVVQGLLLGQMAASGGGDGFHPIDDLKAWWAKRKKDKAVQSIVDKLKDDPDVAAFMNLSNSAQRGKWYKLIEPKLNDEEKKYLRSITRTPFMNEEVNEDSAGTFELKMDWTGKDIHGKKVTLKKGTKLKHERSGGFGQDYMKSGSITINGDDIDQTYLSAPY